MKTKFYKLIANTIVLLLALFHLSDIPLYAQSGWFTSYTLAKQYFLSTYFINTNTGFMVGVKQTGNNYYPCIIKTTNAGSNWFEQITPVSDTAGLIFMDVYFTDVNTGLATLSHNTNFSYGRILRTTNGGTNWYTVHIPEYCTNIYFVNSLTGYVSGHHYIFKTTDGGINWINQNPNFTQVLGGIYFTDVNTGYVVGNNGNIRKTTDGGNNWFSLYSNVTKHLWGLWFINTNTGFIVGGYWNPDNNIILKTTDSGNNWEQVAYTYSNKWLYTVRFLNTSTGFILGYGSQVLKTTNSGINWFNQSLPGNNYFARSCFFTSATTGFIAGHPDLFLPNDTVNYIYKTTNGGGDPVGIIPVVNDIPSEYNLLQNFPNPFNPSTKISFELPNTCDVKLTVYDVLGREVALLVNKYLKPGSYEINWDAGNYPSGVYFYKLSAGDYTETRKMILIK
jgi:photosystem II stability/assembly factor-like uncharacterized protein